jgi:hypothetical protein
MKTKNIFRMLLVAAALLLGANNVKADETFNLWVSTDTGGTAMNSLTQESLDNTLLQKINEGDVINFYGSGGTNSGWSFGLMTGNNNQILGTFYDYSNNNPLATGVASFTVTADQVEKLHDTNYPAKLGGMNVTLTRVEVVHTGKSNLFLAFTSSQVSVNMGETAASPALNNTNVTVSYSSGDTNIAIVNAETGEVTPVNVGSTTITATFAEDDTYNATTANYTIVVNKGTPILSFPESSYTAVIGETFTPPTLYNPYNLSVYYFSYNTYPADVDRTTGAITLKNPGNIEVIAKFDGNDNWNGGEAKYALSINESAVTHYTINNNGATNGSVSTDKSTAAAGETVTLSNTPNTGYELDYYIVTGENNTTIEVNGNQFTMPAGNVWISAVFKQTEYTITINASENGTVSADKTTGLHYNDYVTLTITPNSDFELDQLFVKDANNNPINVNNNQFQMPASNVTVSATFKSASQQDTPSTYTITINSMQNGNVEANKTSDITAGETITLTVTPNSGYQLTRLNVKDADGTTINVDNNYSFIMPASNVTISAIFSLTSIGTENASIGEWGYATFSSGSALNFANVTGIKAYVATSVDNQQVTLTQVMGTVAGGTGLVIIRDNDCYETVFEIPVVQSGSEYNNNLLVPGDGNPLTLSNRYTDYVLTVKDREVKFAEVWSEEHLPTIEVGKAYLRIPATNGARTRSLSVVINNGTTGINAIENDQDENVIYNLRGQRVENPTKGLYIINGKKVIIK